MHSTISDTFCLSRSSQSPIQIQGKEMKTPQKECKEPATCFKNTTTSVFRCPTGTQWSSFPKSNSWPVLFTCLSPTSAQTHLSPELNFFPPLQVIITTVQSSHASPSWSDRVDALEPHTGTITRTHCRWVIDLSSNTARAAPCGPQAAATSAPCKPPMVKK